MPFPLYKTLHLQLQGQLTILKNKFHPEETTLPATGAKPNNIISDYYNYGSGSLAEIHLHNGEFLHNIGLRGQGMQIAMLDGGFLTYTSLKAFDSANINAQVLSTWDFVDRHASVLEDHHARHAVLLDHCGKYPGPVYWQSTKGKVSFIQD